MKMFQKVLLSAYCLGLPLLVIPPFLDFAQEAKTTGLFVLLVMALSAIACSAKLATAVSTVLRTWWMVLLPLAFLVLINIGQAMLSESPSQALHSSRGLVIALLAAVLCASFCKAEALVRFIFVGASLTGLIGLLQVGFDVRLLIPTTDPGQFPAVTFGNRGLASLFVGLGLLPGLHLLRGGRNRAVVAVGLVIQAAFVAVCMTRAVWIGVFCGLVTWFLLARDSSPRHPQQSTIIRVHQKNYYPTFFVALTLLFVAGVSLAIVANDSLRLLLTQRLDPANWLDNPRLTLWRVMVEQWVAGGPDAIVFGFGPGSFQAQAAGWLSTSTLAGRTFLDAHNDVLQWLVEGGILAVGLAGLAVYLCFRATILRRPIDTAIRALYGNAALMVGASLFFYPLQLPYFLSLFWLCLLSPLFATESTETFGSTATPLLLWRVGGAVLACLLLIEVVRRSQFEIEMRRYAKGSASYTKKLKQSNKLRMQLKTMTAPHLYVRLLDE